jgi:hypothetical protein
MCPGPSAATAVHGPERTGVRRGLRTAPVGSPSCPPGTYKTEHSACTCIRMVFRTFIRIRICIRVHLGILRDRQLLDIDIAQSTAAEDVAAVAPTPQLPHPSGCMHKNQISSTVTLDHNSTPLGDACDVRHNRRTHLHNERRARGVPGCDDGNKKTTRGGKPAPGSARAVNPPVVTYRPAAARSRAARSVRSQVKSGSVRPKWP